jgi:ATP-dependent RNA helicase RhlE
LAAIERTIGQPVPVFTEHPYHSEAARLSTMKPPILGGGGRNGGGHRAPAGRPAAAKAPRQQYRHTR